VGFLALAVNLIKRAGAGALQGWRRQCAVRLAVLPERRDRQCRRDAGGARGLGDGDSAWPDLMVAGLMASPVREFGGADPQTGDRRVQADGH
jgi:hypothetical protein